jgi:hypothetical protein
MKSLEKVNFEQTIRHENFKNIDQKYLKSIGLVNMAKKPVTNRIIAYVLMEMRVFLAFTFISIGSRAKIYLRVLFYQMRIQKEEYFIPTFDEIGNMKQLEVSCETLQEFERLETMKKWFKYFNI